MSDQTHPLMVADSIWWVGVGHFDGELNCNPYLILDDNCAVLIDPGSVLDFEQVWNNVVSLVDPLTISHIILHHQDPDLCSSIPLFEKRGVTAKIVTHWRSRVLIKYYGVTSEFYIVDKNSNRLILPSGRTLEFIHTPYLHFPGAIVTYDQASGTLFSSDLFGAFYIDGSLKEFYAGDEYLEPMKMFHEHYMPGNEQLRPVMEMFLGMKINMIASQHGSIIRDNIPKFIRALRDLECGSFIRPIRKNIARERGYEIICNEILKRCHAIAGLRETIAVFDGTAVTLDPVTGFIVDFSTSGPELWHNVFRIIQQRRGAEWLGALEVLVRKISADYDIEIPDVYESAITDIARQADRFDKKYREMSALNEQLLQNVSETQEQLLRDVTSGLYNNQFFMQYLQNELTNNPDIPVAFMLISIDNLQQINFRYGTAQGNDVVRGFGWLIKEHKTETMIVARMEGALFGVFMAGVSMETAIKWAESLRIKVAKSAVFIEPITVSAGVVHSTQVPSKNMSVPELIHFYHGTAGLRLRISRKRGSDYVCTDSIADMHDEVSGRVVVIEPERVNADILTTMLRQMDLSVENAVDGEEAMKTIELLVPDIIICELMLQKIDGFGIREKLIESSALKKTPFILMSHVKDDSLVRRAQGLGIAYFYKKPYMLSELVGLVRMLIRGVAVQ